MAGSKIIDTAHLMFGFRLDGSTPFVYNMKESPINQGVVLAEKYVKTDAGKVLTDGLGIDCSNLVQQSLLGSGYVVPWFQAAADQPASFMKDGLLTPRASKYFDLVDPSDLQPGDLILFAGPATGDHGGTGHVGIVETAPGANGIGTFYGSQSSTGPGGNQRFNIVTGKWSNDTIVTGLRIKDSAYDPDAAAQKLEPILTKRDAELGRLIDKDPNQVDAALRTVGQDALLLQALRAGNAAKDGSSPDPDASSGQGSLSASTAPAHSATPWIVSDRYGSWTTSNGVYGPTNPLTANGVMPSYSFMNGMLLDTQSGQIAFVSHRHAAADQLSRVAYRLGNVLSTLNA